MSMQIEAEINQTSREVTQFTIPRDGRGRIRWKSLRENPEHIQTIIESEITRLSDGEEKLSHNILVDLGRNDLAVAINRYYPGKWPQLRKNLELGTPRKDNYWNDAANIEEEARRMVEKGSSLSNGALNKSGQSSLDQAIRKYYPGGIRQLRSNLGLEGKSRRDGFWTVENIEAEAMIFYSQTGEFTYSVLEGSNKNDLLHAVQRHYPGGLRSLQGKLGARAKQHTPGYWQNPDVIETEVQKFLASGRDLSNKELRQTGFSSLSMAIAKYYPGGMAALREKLRVMKTEQIPSDQANEQLSKLLGVETIG